MHKNAGIVLIVVDKSDTKKVCPIIAIDESIWDRLNNISDHDLLKTKTDQGFFSREEFQSVINGEINYDVIRVHYKDATVSDVQKLVQIHISNDLSSFVSPEDMQQIPYDVRYDAYMFTCDSLLHRNGMNSNDKQSEELVQRILKFLFNKEDAPNASN